MLLVAPTLSNHMEELFCPLQAVFLPTHPPQGTASHMCLTIISNCDPVLRSCCQDNCQVSYIFSSRQLHKYEACSSAVLLIKLWPIFNLNSERQFLNSSPFLHFFVVVVSPSLLSSVNLKRIFCILSSKQLNTDQKWTKDTKLQKIN